MDTLSSKPNNQPKTWSLENALVDCNLIYDPVTKKLCLKNSGNDHQIHIHNNDDQNLDSIIKNGSKNGYGSVPNECSKNGICKKQTHYNNDLKNENFRANFTLIHNNNNNNVHNSSDLDVNSSDNIKNSRDSLDLDFLNEYYETFDGNIPIHSIKRPNNLPPKSKHEERKHRAQFLEILKHAQTKDLIKKNLQKVNCIKQVQQENEIQKAIKLWSDEILPGWTSNNTTKRVQDSWWNGIPSSIRPKVWNMVIGNDLNLTEQLFHICVKRSKEKIWTKQFRTTTISNRRSSNPSSNCLEQIKTHRRANSTLNFDVLNEGLENFKFNDCQDDYDDDEPDLEDEEEDNENIAFLIKLDVLRTFPQLGLFQETGPYHESLCDILSAYVVYRPDIGYCQGMSFLAAMLLLNSQSPTNAFISLANLLNNELLLAFYSMDQAKMRIIYSYYDRQFHSLMPILAKHFVSIGLTTDLFFMYQVYTIFARSLSLDCVSRVWDLFLRDGNEFIFRASLAILSMYQKELLQLEFIDSAKFLTNLPDEMDIDKYFETIASIRLIPPTILNLLAASNRHKTNGGGVDTNSKKPRHFINKFLRF